RAAFDRGRDAAQREDGARRADHAIEADLDDVVEVAIDFFADELRHLALVTARDRNPVEEELRQADHADLEAAREVDLASRAARDLDAAAADVDHHGGLRRVDAVHRGEMN